MRKIIFVILLYLIGCSSSFNEWKEWEDNKDYFQFFIAEEGDTFVDYELITVMNYNQQIFHILSKERPKNEKPPFEKYERIKNGFYYKVKFSKIDSIIVLKSLLNIRTCRGPVILIEKINDKTINIWSDDTLRVPAYTSENIYGTYIEIFE